jgi:hypothetical protein
MSDIKKRGKYLHLKWNTYKKAEQKLLKEVYLNFDSSPDIISLQMNEDLWGEAGGMREIRIAYRILTGNLKR